MKCLLKYQWVKLPRELLLSDQKGILGHWTRLASRAAFRNGQTKYCGYINEVTVGSWAGGVVGLKSILGQKSRATTLEIMDELSALGYISYHLDPETKKLTYKINDWVVKCSGADCDNGTVYTTEGYGFLCLPRNITQRLTEQNYKFEDADAWLDLWCHTVYQDPRNAFTYMAPAVQFSMASMAPPSHLRIWAAVGAGKKLKCGDSYKNMGMPSRCTSYPVLSDVSFSIICTRPVRTLQCPHRQKSHAFWTKYAFRVKIRIYQALIITGSTE